MLALLVVTLACGVFTVGRGQARDSRALLAPTGFCAGDSTIGAPAAIEQQTMLCLVNYARSRDGVSPLRLNAKLAAAARMKLTLDLRFGELSHTPGGVTFRHVFDRCGYIAGATYWFVGENLAYGRSELGTPAKIMATWLTSPEHRRNLLNPSFRETGLAYRSGRFLGLADASLWVQVFGVRRAA
jgi:uncharacterized protein YkwD